MLYSCEEVKAATSKPGTERRERSGMGTMPYMPPIMGQTIAGYVIRQITGVGADPVRSDGVALQGSRAGRR